MSRFSVMTLFLASLGLSLWAGDQNYEIYPIHLECPTYDPLARQARIQGDIKLRLSVEQNGGVESVSVIDGPPLLAGAAEKNARSWRFNRGQNRSVDVTYKFRLKDPAVECDPPASVVFDLPSNVEITSNFRQINSSK